MIKDKLKRSTNEFLDKHVFGKSEFKEITEDNIEQIVDYILLSYVNPLVIDQEQGLKIDENLLKSADDAIDDIQENT